MWPPHEMLLKAKLKIRLMTIRPKAWPPTIWPVAKYSSTSSAPKRPKIAPDAPTVVTSGAWRSAPAEPASSETK